MEYYHFSFIIIEADKDISSKAFTIAVEKGLGDYGVSIKEAEVEAIEGSVSLSVSEASSLKPVDLR